MQPRRGAVSWVVRTVQRGAGCACAPSCAGVRRGVRRGPGWRAAGQQGRRAAGAAGQQNVAAHAIGLGLYSSSRKYSDCCSTVTPLARRKARSSGT